MTFRPTGVYAACLTPMRDDESLDLDRLASHIEFLLDSGISGILATGGCGEYANLEPDERRLIVAQSVKIVAGRVPVVAGALGPSTREAVGVGTHAAEAGADAVLVLPPYYIRPSLDGVLAHFSTVAKESGLPVIAYNIPSRTGWPLGLDHLIAISEIDGVVALKECERDMASISLKIAGLKGRLNVLSGDDDLGFATILSGATGAIWASANLCPKLCVSLYEACQAGDVAKGLGLHNRLNGIFETWMLPNHPGPLKQACALAGRAVGPARAPLMPMTPEQKSRLEAALREHGPVE